MQPMILNNVTQGNLKNISLSLPKGNIILLTGVSGSGKSTLAIDVIFQECQRQYLEALGMEGIQKPDIEVLKNANASICVTQKEVYKNPRSTVGTRTDIYTDLRMLYEKLSKRSCPYCHTMISNAECIEETKRVGDDFIVSMYCSHCHKKMLKYTRTYFSYNTREGACPTCLGLGETLTLQKEKVCKEECSLEDGAITFWKHKYKDFQIQKFYHALTMCQVPIPEHQSLSTYTKAQKDLLWYGSEDERNRHLYPNGVPKTAAKGYFEGIEPYLWKKVSDTEGSTKQWKEYFHKALCPSCHGERLREEIRCLEVKGMRLPSLANITLEEVKQWIDELYVSLNKQEHLECDNYILDIQTKLKRIMQVGLGYLSLDRLMMTLSGGEAQRLKLSSVLASTMSGLLYILDEPTAGLHKVDTAGLLAVIKELRDLGNTILIIEHDEEVIRFADYIVDLGVGSGKHGGDIVVHGTIDDVMNCPVSKTGQYLKHPIPSKTSIRNDVTGWITIKNATLHNLKNISLKIPKGIMVGVHGVSGSGKSSLIFGVLANNKQSGMENVVDGLQDYQAIISIDQSPPNRMKRSNVATYCDAYTHLRALFAKQPMAKQQNFTSTHFSFNTSGGRCERCLGMGTIVSNLLFFQDIEIPCPVCGGKRFTPEVLAITWKGYTIYDMLRLSVEEAAQLCQEEVALARILNVLIEAGLGYLELGQSLTTLSQGEAQRCKLVKELLTQKDGQCLYLLDEPTNGLHPYDIEQFLILLNKLVDQGNSVIVVEHNESILQNCDWLVELGVGGGIHGGEVMKQGFLFDFIKK